MNPPTRTALTPSDTARLAAGVIEEIEKAVVGRRRALELVLLGVLGRGHVLLEDVPGLGKTMMARCFSEALGLSFRRVQFTPDLLPADITGISVFDPGTSRFDFRPGPVFTQILLADEINRSPAKTHAALLEIMQEYRVTIDGVSHTLDRPFLVLATQNPIESEGTYPLPEAQVDRFLFKLIVDYPSVGEEAAVVGRAISPPAQVRERLSTEDLTHYQELARRVFVDRDVIAYAVALADATRHPGKYGLHELEGLIEFGASPRGSINLVHAGRALALLRGRDYVLPIDVRDLARDVLRHRIVLTYEALAAGVDADRVLDDVLERVQMPRIELAEDHAR